MKPDTAKRLHDAPAASREIISFVEGRSLDDYLVDRLPQLSIERLLGIVGAALNGAARADPGVPDSITDLRRFVDVRNRIIHTYDSVDTEIVWSIVARYVPRLIVEIDLLLADADQPRDDY